VFNEVNNAKHERIRSKEDIMRKTITMMVAALLLLPLQASAEGRKHGKNNEFQQAVKSKVQAHREQQKAENKDFKKSMKDSDMARDQKVDTMKDHRETQYEENVALQEQIHKEKIDHLEDKLSKNEKLTDAQKQEIIDRRETQYQENTTFRAEQYDENMRAMDQILGNEELSVKERKIQMKEFRAGQREENKEYHQAKQEENKDFRKSFKEEK
jgi:hypothetical protein